MNSSKIVSIRRYPVKSMIGEELSACEVTEKGLIGDRAYGIIDEATGKLANAKNPLKWPNIFKYHAAFTTPPQPSTSIPPVRITLPSGDFIASTSEDIDHVLSESLGRTVRLARPSANDTEFEGYIPKEITELEDAGSVFTRTSPSETFFDIAMVHLITTSTLKQLQELAPQSQIEARRFRPNFIIDVPGGEGFIENSWVGNVLRIGSNVQLKILQRTKRCVMTTLAQGNLPDDRSVLKSIVQHNGGDIGVYAEVITGGEVRVNDRIEWVEPTAAGAAF